MQWIKEVADGSITQGSILDGLNWNTETNPLGVVISNACDFENNKASYVIVAALVPAKDTLEKTIEYQSKSRSQDGNPLNSKQKKTFKEFLINYIHNKNINRYYYFNPNPVLESDPLLIDFQQIRSFDYRYINDGLKHGSIEIVGEFNHPFIEQIMARFVGYTGRVPTERIPDTEIDKEISLIDNGVL